MKNLNLNYLSKDEQLVSKSLLNSIDLFNLQNKVSYFLTESEQFILEKIISFNKLDLKLEFFGGFSGAERKKAKFIFNEFYDVDYDIVCLKASFNSKFHNIKHSDVLGAIYNMGINANRLGDIVLKEDSIYIFVDSLVSKYLIINFSRIGKAVVNFEIISNLEDFSLNKKYQEISVVCSSSRIDNLVSKITNKSRSKVKELFLKDLIKLNHQIAVNYEKNVCIGDLISIRKCGRFIVKNISQNNKSLKYRITVDKLI